MAYFQTVLTYQLPSEAELDKSYLEAQGITVYLMNNQTTRNELGPAFWIQLQVAEEDWSSATRILREARPDRFGSAERVNEIDRVLKRGAIHALVGAMILGVIAYFVVSKTNPSETSSYWEAWEQPVLVAALVGAVAGWRLGGKGRGRK
ncbi:MAG TPA: hypothetical protein VK717_11075 [Opitutaceae bacterium]|jgi:hypothetical protein|nr:hypothetical protein [Opitutaceae bacterium]